MDKKTVEYYKWDDIQKVICDKMGITNDDFRDYHRVVGGKFKDLWYEWLNYFDSDIKNGGIISLEMGERIDIKKEWVSEDGKDWLHPFIDAVYATWDEYDIKYVKYSW